MKKLFAAIFFLFSASFAFSQSSYLDLTIVESSNYNKAIANFSYSTFESSFKITSNRPDIFEEDINRALVMFLNILEPTKSYIIQHEPTYYFVLQFNKKDQNYLVMNNSIGEKNEAIYVNTFNEAKKQMFLLLQAFYNNIPVVSIKEFK